MEPKRDRSLRLCVSEGALSRMVEITALLEAWPLREPEGCEEDMPSGGRDSCSSRKTQGRSWLAFGGLSKKRQQTWASGPWLDIDPGDEAQSRGNVTG